MIDLKTLFEQNPSLKKSHIAREAGISHSLIIKLENGDRNLTQKTEDKLRPILKKYIVNFD